MILYKKVFPILTFLFCPCLIIYGQNPQIIKAETLHNSYQFEEAKQLYQKVLEYTTDSLSILDLEEKITQCDNGTNLLSYTVSPTPVAVKNVPLTDFYLYFPDLPDHSFIPIPNPFVQDASHKYVTATYFPGNPSRLYFSAPDNSGSWNIYETSLIEGNLWSEPKILNESLTSSGDEIFPLLSADGKELYFASNGHFGMGGFDLYVSKWDEDAEEWGFPENLGFPYSSTGNDLMFLNTLDGNYSMLASDRDSEKDSIGIYVLEFIGTPVTKPLTDLTEIIRISHLLPEKDSVSAAPEAPDTDTSEKDSSSRNGELDNYSQLVSEMISLQNEHKKKLEKLEEQRKTYEKVTNEGDKEFLIDMINDLEEEANQIREKMETATAKVQKAELDFLSNGVIPSIPDPEEMVQPEENKPAEVEFTFEKHSLGDIPNLAMQQPKPKFDYSFQIQKEARFAEDNTLPSGIIYQIQLFVLSQRGSLKSYKGLSPIFEIPLKSGKLQYDVGLFSTHAEALSCLNQVRKAGFPKAFVVAFENGKPISVKEARLKEGKKPEATYQVIIANYQSGLPEPIVSAINECCDKDIAKSEADGQITYIIGPFAKKGDAEYLSTILMGLGVDGVSVELVKL